MEYKNILCLYCSPLLRWVVIWVSFLYPAVALHPVFETFIMLSDLLETSVYIQKLPDGTGG